MALIEIFKPDARRKYEDMMREIIDLQERHNINVKTDLLQRAFDFAYDVHREQKRKDGSPYIVHPLAVARTCAEYWMDDISVAGALLHDTIEDADPRRMVVTREVIGGKFGEDVARIVEGVTKFKQKNDDETSVAGISAQDLKLHFGLSQIETLKKLLSSAAMEDIRAIIVKIFDRYDNVKSIGVFKKSQKGPEKQRRIEYETRMFYIPIAARLGLFKVAREMEDNLMKALDSNTYNAIQKWLSQNERKVRPVIDNIIKEIHLHLQMRGIECTEKFYHRGIYQIYEQLQERKMGIEQIENATVYNLTLIVPTQDDCYRTLGIVHNLYPHLRDSVFDYISNPKINGYQSLHTIILAPGLSRLQILIRTAQMDTKNHLGIIAEMRRYDGQMNQSLVDWLGNLVSSFDVIDRHDFFDITSKVLYEEIEVITPKGERKHLPVGSTALDFAFSIHSEVGVRAKSAIIDGKEKKLNTVLKKGQRVQIITDDKPQAKPHWFGWVIDSNSKLALRKYFKKAQKQEVEQEKEKFLNFCKEKLGIKIDTNSWVLDDVRKKMGYNSMQEFLEDLHTGRLMYEFVIPHLVMNIGFRECRKLCNLLGAKGVISKEDSAAMIKECGELEIRESLSKKLGSEFSNKFFFSEYVEIPKLKYPLPVHFARCCFPNPPCSIVALTSKEKGAVIHRSNCNCIAGMKEFGSINLVEAKWKKSPLIRRVFVRFEGNDRPNLLHDLMHIFHDLRSNILEISVKVQGDNKFSGEVLFQLSDVIVDVEMIKGKMSSVKSLRIVDVQIVQ